VGLVRKQFFIDADQNRQLKRLASSVGKSEGELIREGVAARLAAAKAEDDWRSGLDRIGDSWVEREHLQEEMAELRKGWRKRLKRLRLDTGTD
jgi:hypothetical protein